LLKGTNNNIEGSGTYLDLCTKILRLLGRLVPKDDRYRANLFIDFLMVGLYGFTAIRVPVIANDVLAMLLALWVVVVISVLCLLGVFFSTPRFPAKRLGRRP
jgi:hypothetical protein